MAGGGVKGGLTIGTADEVGLHAVDKRLHVLNEGEAYRKIVG